MNALRGRSPVRTGLMGLIVVLLVIGVGQSFANVPMLFATPTYYAQFSDTGQLARGDKVRIAGVEVGQVRSIDIQGDKIVIGYSLGGKQIGTDSRAAIRTDTILGRKDLEIQPRGSRTLRPNAVLPVEQTTTPYQIYDAFTDVTKAAAGWDVESVKRSLDVLAQTIDQTYPHLSDALRGVERFSDTIGKRDEQIKTLLGNANKVATVLGDRGGQIDDLLVNAQTLLAAVNERGRAIDRFLQHLAAVSEQITGFIKDNPNLSHVLEQLKTITDLLVQRKGDLSDTVVRLARYVVSAGDAAASGPYFKAMLSNLLPYPILQPFVDAAFKKRGIDPEQFWRNAGLPAFRFPDPNGSRFANRAPPPAPGVLEGTPEHPGPAVLKGSPCSYTPPADGIPSPADPLPCAGLSVGPFGGVPYLAPDVLSSPPNPAGMPNSPGVPSAALPGQSPPQAPGTPAPLAPGPPGARTVPLAPPPPGPAPQMPPVGTDTPGTEG
jgi:phospholipid/cholesterol/gamma-HCH transport system substrate-binding protein